MKRLLFIIVILTCFSLKNCLFIRPFDTYNSIIQSVYHFYRCHSITILNTVTNFDKSKEIQLMNEYRNYFNNFSELLIPITIINIKSFVLQTKNRGQFQKSLFVFLNDFEDIQKDINKVLIPSIDISKPTSLIFFRPQTTINSFFKNTNIPFNCKFMVVEKNTSDVNREVITEIYRPNPGNDLRRDIFATWSPDEGMKLPELSLYKRRNDLYGTKLRISLVDIPPFMIAHRNADGLVVSVEGFFGDIVNILQSCINFTVQYETVRGYGTFRNGKWTGAMGSLVYNQSDIFAGIVPFLRSRIDAITYGSVISLLNARLVFQKPSKHIEWNRYLQAFDTCVWITILIIIFMFSVILTWSKSYHRPKLTKILDNRMILSKLVDNLLSVYGAFCGQGMERSAVDSINILQFTLHITAIIISACYSAVLISTLAVSSEIPRFGTVESFHKSGTYTMGFLNDSSLTDFFQSSSDEIMQKVIKKSEHDNALVPKNSDGFERICTDKNFAFAAFDISISGKNIKNCNFLTSDPILRFSMSIGLKRNSPYSGVINHYISQLKYTGIIDNLFRRWITTASREKEDAWSVVDYIDVAPLFGLIMLNTILGFLILFCERLIYKKIMERKIATISKRLITTVKYPKSNPVTIVMNDN